MRNLIKKKKLKPSVVITLQTAAGQAVRSVASGGKFYWLPHDKENTAICRGLDFPCVTGVHILSFPIPTRISIFSALSTFWTEALKEKLLIINILF